MPNFAEKYANLVAKGDEVPVTRLGNYPHTTKLPEGYGKEWVHPENGFVNLFCKDYDNNGKGDAQEE